MLPCLHNGVVTSLAWVKNISQQWRLWLEVQVTALLVTYVWFLALLLGSSTHQKHVHKDHWLTNVG